MHTLSDNHEVQCIVARFDWRLAVCVARPNRAVVLPGVAWLAWSARYARYFYYTGRIKAIRLEYTEAHNYLLDAIRKAPQTGAVGFRLEVRRPAPPR